jgi:hypothetical protein
VYRAAGELNCVSLISKPLVKCSQKSNFDATRDPSPRGTNRVPERLEARLEATKRVRVEQQVNLASRAPPARPSRSAMPSGGLASQSASKTLSLCNLTRSCFAFQRGACGRYSR